MKFNNLLGQIHISNSTIFDSHLLWLIIPVLFTAFLLFAKPSKWGSKTKNIAVKFSAFLLITSVALAVVLRYPAQSFNETVSSLSIFNNLDIIVALLFGVTLISKRFWLTRILIPGAIVISLMRLINNPGGDIAYAELIVDLTLICSAIMLVPVFNRSITVSGHLTLVTSTLITLAYVFVYNKFHSTNFSTLSLAEIASNPFYNWLHNDILIIVSFLSVIVFFETVIWLAIRTWFSVSARKNKLQSTMASVKYEWIIAKKAINSHLSRFEIANEFYLELSVADEAFEQEEQTNTEIKMLDNLAALNEKPKDTFIMPPQLIGVKTSKGIRAPSLV